MDDVRFMGEFVIGAAAMTAPIIVLTKSLAGDQSGEIYSPNGIAWPHGVQEEEPVRWNVRLLDRTSGRDRQVQARHPRRHRPLPLTR